MSSRIVANISESSFFKSSLRLAGGNITRNLLSLSSNFALLSRFPYDVLFYDLSLLFSGWFVIAVYGFIIPPASTKLKGWFTGFTLSVCPSVDRIVSTLYIQQYLSDPFHICTCYQAAREGVACNVYLKS